MLMFVRLKLRAALFRVYTVWIVFDGFITFVVNFITFEGFITFVVSINVAAVPPLNRG